jgi:ABC-type lipoprotein release transport system permease subunit
MLLRLAWKNVWRNRLRSTIMMASMVFGLLGVILMVGFVRAMTANMLENAIKYQTAHLQVHTRDFLLNEELAAWLPEADRLAADIRRQPGVTGAAVRQVVNGMMASAANSRGVRINGIEVADEVKVTAVAEKIIKGTILPAESRNPILISKRSAERLKFKLGSKVILTFSDRYGDVTGAAFRVTGIFNTPSSSFDEANVFVRRNDLAKLTGLDQAHEIAIRLTDGNSLANLKQAAMNIVGNKAQVQDWGEVMPILATMTGTMNLSNNIMIGVFVLALGFGIVNIMLMAVFERTREFGMMMAIGMTGSRVLRLVILESLLLGGLGGLLGLMASFLLIALTGRIGLPFGTMAEGLGVFGVDTVLYPEVPLSNYLGTLGMVLLTSLLAALYPARQILKKRLSEALAEKH